MSLFSLGPGRHFISRSKEEALIDALQQPSRQRLIQIRAARAGSAQGLTAVTQGMPTTGFKAH